jgi:RNA polymerase sigma-70 factor, ECF subfamily
MLDTVSDADLVEVARRDPAAFDTLYRRYLPGVYRYALARAGSVPVAEDIAAAVFVDVLAGLPNYQEQGRFPAWLFTIVRRHVSAYHRQASGTVPVDDMDIPVSGESEHVERLALLGQAMTALTDDRREALTLRFLGGLKVTEVAAAMGKGESATKMLIHRGLVQLRGLLTGADESATVPPTTAPPSDTPNAVPPAQGVPHD